ncbi:COG1470 family protein [Natrialbaceae archaeon A-gly3]
MTELSVDALSEFRSALEDGDEARALELIGPLRSDLESWSQQALAREELAHGVELSGEAPTDAETYLAARETARQQRLEFAYAIYAFADGSAPPEDVLEPTRAMERAVEEVSHAAAELESTRDELEIPPRLSLRGPAEAVELRTNESADVPLTLENVGGSEADSIDLSVTRGFEGVRIDPDTVSRLRPGETTTVMVSFDGLDAGEYAVLVQGGNEASSVTADLAITVFGRVEYVAAARRQLDELVVQTERVAADVEPDGSTRGNSRGNGNSGDNRNYGSPIGPLSGLVNRAKTSRDRLIDVERTLSEGGDGHDVDGKLRAVRNTLEAYENQVNAQSGHNLSETDAVRLRSDARTVRNLIDDALETR